MRGIVGGNDDDDAVGHAAREGGHALPFACRVAAGGEDAQVEACLAGRFGGGTGEFREVWTHEFGDHHADQVAARARRLRAAGLAI